MSRPKEWIGNTVGSLGNFYANQIREKRYLSYRMIWNFVLSMLIALNDVWWKNRRHWWAIQVFYTKLFLYDRVCKDYERFWESDHSATGGGKRMLNAVIIFMVCISCIPYYFKYEKKKPQTRESVVLAVNDSHWRLTSRIVILHFHQDLNQLVAMVDYLWYGHLEENRAFLCGSLSAVVSELLFWTRTMDSISDACMGNDRMDLRNFKSEKWLENSKILLTIFGIFQEFHILLWWISGHFWQQEMDFSGCGMWQY